MRKCTTGSLTFSGIENLSKYKTKLVVWVIHANINQD